MQRKEEPVQLAGCEEFFYCSRLMVPQELSSLASEYVHLWRDHGLEGIEELPERIENLLSLPLRPPSFSLSSVREELGDCKRCGLCETRVQIVFGQGNERAELMFVGEGPGTEEDQQGTAFVGKAGELLTKILEAMKTSREEVYITNIVKCRPPESRSPEPFEIEQCFPFLRQQVSSVNPRVIVALGGTATGALLGPTGKISNLRGKMQPLPWMPEIQVMPTFHPAYLLKNPDAKKMVWEDMKLVLESLAGGR